MALRFGDALAEDVSDAEVNDIIGALKEMPDPAPMAPEPRPRRSRRKTAPAEPVADVSRETSAAGDEAGAFAADPDPDYGRSDLADKLFPDNPMPPKKISQAIQKDIRGKVAMLLTIGGAGWASRDPYCGGEFLDAIPDRASIDEDGHEETSPGLASALTDIFVDSPEIVNWFTTSGKYMKWLTLAMVIQPLLAKMWAHHVSHSVQDNGEEPSQDWGMYATH